MMTLTTLLASCDANISANGVINQKVMLHHILIAIDLRNAVVPLMTALASHDTDANTNSTT